MADIILDFMKREGVPLTKANYMYLQFMGDVPDEPQPELEAEMPEEIKD